jgi:hypothetical protein
MAQDQLHSRPDFGRTFTVALWLLGTVATLQAISVGWALLTRPLAAPELAAALPEGEGEAAPELPFATPNGGSLPILIVEKRPGLLPRPAAPAADPGGGEFSDLPPTSEEPRSSIAVAPPLPGPSFTGPETDLPLSTRLSHAALQAPAPLQIPDPEVAGFVTLGAEKRASGDMQGALDSLRRAEALLPDHPRVLAEIAATFGQLGMDAKSALYWERVRDMGPKAGDWHAIASSELSGQKTTGAKLPAMLKLGKVAALHDPAVTKDQGERVVLSVTVDAAPGARPSAKEMSMLVYFYDMVDGEKTEASTADTSQKFSSEPYDWATPAGETIEVIYHQPVFSVEEKRELGKRAYYGYIIELYYRDELQDMAAFPPELKNLDRNTIPSPLSEPTKPMFGPENSLFPSVPVPDNE